MSEKNSRELLQELQQLKQENNALKLLYNKKVAENEKLSQRLHSFEWMINKKQLNISDYLEERKKAEDRLNELKERYQIILDTTSDFAFSCIKKINGYEIDWVAGAVKNITGYSVEEVYANKCWHFMVHPDDDPIFVSQLLSLMPGEESQCELRIIDSNGAVRWLSVKTSCFIDEGDNQHKLYGGCEDITNHKQTELLLQRKNKELHKINQELLIAKEKAEDSEHRFRQVSETAQELIWEVDCNGLYTYVSSVIEPLLGYTADELVGKKYFYDLFIPEKREEYKQKAFEIFAQRQAVRNFENTLLHKNGHAVIVKTAGGPLVDEDGNFMGYSGLDEDITERKQAKQALQKSNQRLESLLSISQKITSTIDQDTIMQMIVDDANKLIGLDTGAIYLKSDDETIRLSVTTPALPNDFPDELRNASVKYHPHLNKALQTGKYVLMEDAFSVQLTAEEKKIVDLRKLRTNLYQPIMLRGKIMGVLILSSIETPRSFASDDLKMIQAFANQAAHIIDNVKNYTSLKKHTHELEQQIKQREKVEKALVIAKEKAEESDRLKSAFMANVSHEIRTPMNGILGFSNLLLDPDFSSEERENFIKIVQQSGQRMLNTVTNIMEISKIESGIIHLSEEEIDLNESVAGLIRFFKPEAEKKGVKLIVDKLLPLSESNILTDQNKFDSVLTNLIKNAIKFTETGHIIVGCTTEKTNANAKLQFYVKDTGIGIRKDRIKAIFNRFEQADIADTRAFEGSGLGLAIAKSYVEMQGGSIWVESVEGKGSTFYFTIPFKSKIKEPGYDKSFDNANADYKSGLNQFSQ